MKVTITRNPFHAGTFDLWVDGKLEVEGETMQVIDGVRASLEWYGRGATGECREVAANIRRRMQATGDQRASLL